MNHDGFAPGWRAVLVLLTFALLTCTVLGEEGVLVLVVMDTEQHPFANVRIGTAGDSGSPEFSDQNGKARLKLSPNTKPAAWVTLLLMSAPNGLDLAFISPYDGRIRVPPFDNEQDNYDPVILARRGDKAMLESGSGMLAIHANANRTAAAQKKKPATPHTSRNSRPASGSGYAHLQTVGLRTRVAGAHDFEAQGDDAGADPAMAAVASIFGLPVPEIQAAIEHWGGGDLTWKAILLSSQLDDGGTDPFISVRAPDGNITFGSGAWSLRDCTLQPLLLKFQQADPERFAAIVGRDTAWLTKTMHIPCKAAFTIASERLLGSRNTVDRIWRRRLIQLGNEHAFQHVQVEQMATQMAAAQSMAQQFGLQSEQSVMFCRDMMQQRGSTAVEGQHTAFLENVAAFEKQMGREPDEQERLWMLANRMIQWEKQQSLSSDASASFVSRANLLCRGSGTVAGRTYDLGSLGIGITSTPTGAELAVVNDPAVLKQLQDGWIPGEPAKPTSASVSPAPTKDGTSTDKPQVNSAPASPSPVPAAGPAMPTDGGTPGAKALRASQPAPQDPPSQLPPAQFDPGAEKQLVTLINQERAKVRLQPVQYSQPLTEAARKHSVLMAQHKMLSHQFPGEAPFEVRLAGENVRSDQESENVAMAPDAPAAHKGLMDSPAHRGAILNLKFDAVGVGVVRSGDVLWVTQEFTRALPSFTNAEAAAAIQAAIAKYAASRGAPEPLLQPRPQLQQMACDMAAKDEPDVAPPKQIPSVQRVFVWTTGDVSQLPNNVKEALSQPLPTSYSLGGCFASSASNPGGIYWVVMITY
jgi:uncharacterized protein YkwD